MKKNPRTHQGETRSGTSRFPETRWTRVRQARDSADPASAREAFRRLCGDYWTPLYAYARAIGLSPEDAGRLVNELFYRLTWELFPLHHPDHEMPDIPDFQRPIGKQRENAQAAPILERAEEFAWKNRERHGPHAGRLRDFFMLQLKTIAHSDWRSNSRRSLDGGVFSIDDVTQVEHELDEELKSGQNDSTPDAVFHRRWQATLIGLARQALEAEMERQGEGESFRVLWPMVGREDGAEPTAGEAGRALGISAGNVRIRLMRLKTKLRDHILRQIAETVDSEDPVVLAEEVRALFSAGVHP